MHALQTGENRPLDAPRVRVLVRSPAAVDVSALLLRADGKVRSDADMIFYNQPVGPGVQHSASTGQGDSILIDTTALPSDVERVAVTASLDGSGPATFGQAGPMTIEIGDGLSFTPTNLARETALVCVEVYRRNGQWKVRAVGQGYSSGLAGIATDFGIEVEAEPQGATTPPPSYAASPASGPRPAQPPSAPAHTPPQHPSPQGAQPMQSELFSGKYAEAGGQGIQKQNSKMIRVGLNGEVIARAGSMVAYQGNMRFEALGSGGIGNAIRSRLQGEHMHLMKVSGQGDLFLANAAAEVFIVDLDGTDGLTVNGQNVLAFDPSLEHRIERVQGAAAGGSAGLFNQVFRGRGRIALSMEGYPVVLNVDAPTFADPQAAVAWSSSLRTSVQQNDQFSLRTLVGRSTGERFTLAFSGQGFVIVQASEMPPGGLIGGAGGGERAGTGGVLGGFLGG